MAQVLSNEVSSITLSECSSREISASQTLRMFFVVKLQKSSILSLELSPSLPFLPFNDLAIIVDRFVQNWMAQESS